MLQISEQDCFITVFDFVRYLKEYFEQSFKKAVKIIKY